MHCYMYYAFPISINKEADLTARWSAPLLFAHLEDLFARVEDQLQLSTIVRNIQSVFFSSRLYFEISRDMQFPTMWHLISVDSEEPVQSHFKLRYSK